jgi:S1-C subfamily serine protease
LVREVQDDTPAQKAGLRVDDVITHWNGRQVNDYNALFRMIWLTPPNSRAKVDFLRDGEPHSVEVTVGTKR